MEMTISRDRWQIHLKTRGQHYHDQARKFEALHQKHPDVGADCAALVEKWGLVHTFAPVGRPTGNAVAERVIRTMKEEVIWLRDWKNAAELREALLAWKVRYNTQRPHQALCWMTPAEYRSEKLGLAVQDAA